MSDFDFVEWEDDDEKQDCLNFVQWRRAFLTTRQPQFFEGTGGAVGMEVVIGRKTTVPELLEKLKDFLEKKKFVEWEELHSFVMFHGRSRTGAENFIRLVLLRKLRFLSRSGRSVYCLAQDWRLENGALREKYYLKTLNEE